MKTKTKSEKALIHMVVTMVIFIGIIITVLLWNHDLVKRIYFADHYTTVLNGLIILVFSFGVFHLARAMIHYRFEEEQVTLFINEKQRKRIGKHSIENVSLKSNISKRYHAVRDLYQKQVPINHGAISSIMIAEESLYRSFPKFVNNTLILTGVFGTIVSLIIALLGAGSVLENSIPGKGMSVMLLGMNTALTSTATAIICFFLFTFYYQKLSDIQTYVFGKIEEAVIIHIVPEFSFDTESVNYKTERLISELSGIISEIKNSTGFIRSTLIDFDENNQKYLDKLDLLINSQEMQSDKTDILLENLKKIRGVLLNGFRLGDHQADSSEEKT